MLHIKIWSSVLWENGKIETKKGCNKISSARNPHQFFPNLACFCRRYGWRRRQKAVISHHHLFSWNDTKEQKPIYLHKAKACRIMGYEACRVASATTVLLPSSFDTTVSRLLTQHEGISSKKKILGKFQNCNLLR